MKNLLFARSTLCSLLLTFFPLFGAHAQNTIVFDNQSSEPALVKVIGQSSKEIEVPNGSTNETEIEAGRYTLKVRYGMPGKYHYEQGEEFTIPEEMNSRSTITLHKVAGGNYSSRQISEQDFAAPISDQNQVFQSNKQIPRVDARSTVSNTLDILKNSPDSLVVLSHPIGLNTYVIPLDEFSPSIWATWSSKKYLVGQTPVKVSLKPGKYRVFVTNFDVDVSRHFREEGEIRFFNDGETRITCELPDFVCGGKLYSIEKYDSKMGLLTALFWNKGQSIEDFVKTLPKDDLFDLGSFDEETFSRHDIPQENWNHLSAMWRKTGKAIWYSEERSRNKRI